MALRILPSISPAVAGHIKLPATVSTVAATICCGNNNSNGGRKPAPAIAAEIRSNLQEKTKRVTPPLSSPLHAVEELASRIGLEILLERLFREASGGGDDRTVVNGPPGRPVRVAYQGARGSYCQEAAATVFSASPFSCEAFPCFQMEDAFTALEDGLADRAVVPAENSLDGPIDRNLDLLLRHDDVRIVGELVLPVNHCLLGLSGGGGGGRSGLRRVVSHPQALAHCEARLVELGLEVEEAASAADAARYVAENQIRDTAVIGSRIAAREFGLSVLEQNLQGPGANYTRFLQLGMGGAAAARGGGARKTAVAFSLEKGASDLFRAMWSFEIRGVRVVRVDHRPNRVNPVRVVRKEGGEATYLDYVFVMEVEGSESDPGVATAVAQLGEIAGFVRVLGSYPCTCGSRA